MSVTPSAGNVSLNIINPLNFIQGMQVQWASTTTLSVSTGVAINSTGASNINLDSAVTLNAANLGLNGMDTGALANSSEYYVYAIGRSVDKSATYQGVILSLSSTAPAFDNIPGFDMYRLLDVQKTDGSAHFLKNYNVGNSNQRTKYWDAAISVLSGGVATTLTAIDLSSALPAIYDNVQFNAEVSYTPATAGDNVGFAPFGSTSTSLSKVSSVVAAKAQLAQLRLLAKLDTSTPKALYINSAASGATSVSVSSFTMSI